MSYHQKKYSPPHRVRGDWHGVCWMCKQYLVLYERYEGINLCEDCIAETRRARFKHIDRLKSGEPLEDIVLGTDEQAGMDPGQMDLWNAGVFD